MERAQYTSMRVMLLPVAVLIAALMSFMGQGHAQQPVTFEPSEAAIVTEKGKFDFNVEMALSPTQHAQGLQHRKYLPPTAGMLFNMKEDRVINMWMKNTPISLDMIFIDAGGLITSVAENTEPFSLKTISSRLAARAVLEVNGGTARRIGAKPGDRVLHPMFQAP